MKEKNDLVNYLLVGLLVVGAYFLGSYKTKYELLKTNGRGKGQEEVQAQPEKKTELGEAEWKEILQNPVAVKGSESAPVTIVEFTDYQCPFFDRYFQETYPSIMKEYVDKGKVRYVIRNLPLPFHQHAEEAAIAAYCAGQKGQYWEMHDKLFREQQAWEKANNAVELFAKYGDELGVDIRDCQKDKQAKEVIGKDLELARKIGANGTPTFFINGKMLVGAQPYSTFKAMIEAALSK